MAFVGNIVRSIGKGLGLIDEPPAPIAAPTAPTSASADLDAAAQTQAQKMQGGFTSNLLADQNTYNEDKTKTSKVLLGM